MLTQKKPKKTSRYTKIGKLALVFFGFFFGFFWFFKISKLALFFFGFFWHWFRPEFEIGNCFFWVFLVFFGFFGIGLGQHSKLETGYLGSFGFFFGFFWLFLVFFGIFWYLNLGLEYHPKKNQKNPKKNQKNPKKTQKKPVATPKLVNWLGFLVFFWFFFGVSTPLCYRCIRNLVMYLASINLCYLTPKYLPFSTESLH